MSRLISSLRHTRAWPEYLVALKKQKDTRVKPEYDVLNLLVSKQKCLSEKYFQTGISSYTDIAEKIIFATRQQAADST